MSSVRDDDIRSGPDRYVSSLGSARRLVDYLAEYHNPVIVTGHRSAQAFLQYSGLTDLPARTLRYDGSATLRNAAELAKQAEDADVIVAIGAGRLADTAKNMVERLHSHLIIVPTLAATCAAYSVVSVNYDERHRFVSAPLHSHNSDLVVVDAGLIASGPIDYFIGGIGDTLAKWYESAPVFARASALSAFDRLSQRSAALIRDVLFEESEPALRSLAAGSIDEHVQTVVDTIIGLGGTVGGFGGIRARASGAHAIHDALTNLPESVNIVHGKKVAYGIIIQLLTEGKTDEVQRLLPLYASIGLPHSFAQMGLEPSPEQLRFIAVHAANERAYQSAVPNITGEEVAKAISAAEEL